ncbi:MAG: hypothetical protein U1E29_18415 [Coriobacteriia bacterium]|nr:hypothetical protein [Coriobacteriia bacterium]
MSTQRIKDTFTCDICDKEGLAAAEVARITVSYTRPPEGYWDKGQRPAKCWAGDVCKQCVEAAIGQSVPCLVGLSPKYDNHFSLHSSQHRNGSVLHRFAKWILQDLRHAKEADRG